LCHHLGIGVGGDVVSGGTPVTLAMLGLLRSTGDNIASEDEANTLWVFTLEIPSRPALQLGDEKCLNYVGTEGESLSARRPPQSGTRQKTPPNH